MKGIVVCPQPRAADVGAAVLAKGGNAFDAAIAQLDRTDAKTIETGIDCKTHAR